MSNEDGLQIKGVPEVVKPSWQDTTYSLESPAVRGSISTAINIQAAKPLITRNIT
jgi:hypothetical protein